MRFELAIAADALAVAYYRIDDGILVLIHMEAPFEYSGSGYATRVADGVFSMLRDVNKSHHACHFFRVSSPDRCY